MHQTRDIGVSSSDYARKENPAEQSRTWNPTTMAPTSRLGATKLPGATRPGEVDENCRKVPFVSQPRLGERSLTTDDEKAQDPTSGEAEDGHSPLGLEGDIYDVGRVLEELSACQRDVHRKPSLSYIALISLAILASPSQRLILADIYEWIRCNFPYYRHTVTPSWRNSIRHNLSLNECFVKKGRCERGKCSYWTIHPANVDDFRRYDFRRRHARRRVRMCSSERLDVRMHPQNSCRWTSSANSYIPMNSTSVSTNRLVAMFGAKAVMSAEEREIDTSRKRVMRRAEDLDATYQLQQRCCSDSMSVSNPINNLHVFDAPVSRPGSRYHRCHVMSMCPIPDDFSSAAVATVTTVGARYDGQDGVSFS